MIAPPGAPMNAPETVAQSAGRTANLGSARPLRLTLTVRPRQVEDGEWGHYARWRGETINIRGVYMQDATGAPLTQPYRLHLRTNPRGAYRVERDIILQPRVRRLGSGMFFEACYLDDRWVGQRVSVRIERRPARPRRAR